MITDNDHCTSTVFAGFNASAGISGLQIDDDDDDEGGTAMCL